MFKPDPYCLRQELDVWADAQNVHDSLKREALREVLEAWLAEPRHEFFVSHSPAENEADACAMIRWNTQPDHRRLWMLSNDKRFARISVFEMNADSPKIAGFSPLRLARLSTNQYFGSEYFNGYSDNYIHDFMQKSIRNHVAKAAHYNAQQLIENLAAVFLDQEYCEYELSKEERKKFEGRLVPLAEIYETRAIRGVLHDFVRTLDQDALAIMRRDGNGMRHIYEWLIGSNGNENNFGRYQPAVSATAVKNRQRAGDEFPCLMWHMEFDLGLTEAIDRGDAALTALVERLNDTMMSADKWPVTKEMMQSLRGTRARDIDKKRKIEMGSDNYFNRVHSDLGFLSALPPSWRPQRREHWRVYSHLGNLVSRWVGLTGLTAKDVVRSIMRAANNLPELKLPERGRMSIPDYLATLGTFDNGKAYDVEGSNIGDFFRKISEQVCLPYIFQSAADFGELWNPKISDNAQFNPLNDSFLSVARRLLFRGVSVEKILRANINWHKNATRVHQRASSLSRANKEDLVWPALFDPMTSPEGVVLRCLTSEEELRERGKDHQNCVGGYGYDCFYKNLHVVALEAPDGCWSSTLGLKMESVGNVLFFQHEGARHAGVTDQGQRTEAWLISGINTGTIKINTRQIKAFREIVEKRRLEDRFEEMLARIGFDPFDKDASDKAFRVWSQALRGIFPYNADRCAYLESRGLRDFMRKQVGGYRQCRARQMACG